MPTRCDAVNPKQIHRYKKQIAQIILRWYHMYVLEPDVAQVVVAVLSRA
jgi:hypothetical protein